jgi:hypothetical protein
MPGIITEERGAGGCIQDGVAVVFANGVGTRVKFGGDFFGRPDGNIGRNESIEAVDKGLKGEEACGVKDGDHPSCMDTGVGSPR